MHDAMPLTSGDINKIPAGPGGGARFGPVLPPPARSPPRKHSASGDGPSCPTASAESLPGKNHASCHPHPRGRHPRLLPPPTRPAPGVPSGSPALASGRDRRPRAACRPPSSRHRATWPATRAQWSRSGRPQARTRRRGAPLGSCSAAARGWRSRRSWARGAVVRRPGTVLAVAEAGQIISFDRPGRWTGRSRTWPPKRSPSGRTGSAACGSKRTPRATPACPARSAWTFYAADSPSWPRDVRPQARQERQSPRSLPRPGPAPSQRPCPGPGWPPVPVRPQARRLLAAGRGVPTHRPVPRHHDRTDPP